MKNKKLAKEFPKALKACEDEYNRHYPIKHDSWRQVSPDDLLYLMGVAWRKLEAIEDWDCYELREQLKDVINLGLMTLEQAIRAIPTRREQVGEYYRFYPLKIKREAKGK